MRSASPLIWLLVLVLIAGCASNASDDAVPVPVEIGDSGFDLGVESVSAGPIVFEIENVGTVTHEFEIFAGAEPGQELPVANGVADTSGLTVVEELEDVFPGEASELTVDLKPGTYLLICNYPGHYALGNWAEFTVEG